MEKGARFLKDMVVSLGFIVLIFLIPLIITVIMLLGRW